MCAMYIYLSININEIIELKEARARDQEERAKDQEARTKKDEVQNNILNFLRRKGYDDALTYGGGSTSSKNTFWLVLYLLSTTYTLGIVILIYWCGQS